MKISTKGRYALRMLLDLAEHQSEGYIALKDIAARQDISKKYLEQIINPLTKSGLVQIRFPARKPRISGRIPSGKNTGQIHRR